MPIDELTALRRRIVGSSGDSAVTDAESTHKRPDLDRATR